VTCHRLLNRFFRRVSSYTLTGRGGRGSALGRRVGADAVVTSWMALVSSSTHLSIASSSFNTGFPGSLSSKKVWNAAQSIRVNLGRSVGFERMIGT
jgi:hypothetical protein